jgi:hypothetical protein
VRVPGSLAAALAVLLAAACAETTPPAGGAASPPQAGAPRTEPGDQALWVRITVMYTRPGLFASGNRPISFGFVRDYRTSTAIDELQGVWNDVTQTLTADLSVQLKSENLIFVDDPVVAPESETPIRAGRSGLLHEVTCPPFVPPEHPCYLLQVLR